MPKTPWTHHDLIQLIAPFVQRGRVFDSAATRREERRAAFKPVVHSGIAEGFSIREMLWLENPWPGSFTLMRDLILPNGLVSRLSASGPDPAQLLSTVESVPLERGFHFGHGYTLAKRHTVEPFGWMPASPSESPQLALESAEAAVAGMTLSVAMPSAGGSSAEVRLATGPDDTLALPDDFLAVLGGDWSALSRNGNGWTARLRVRGREPFRSLGCERLTDKALDHLAQTLAAPPKHFHERLVRSRWRAELRRGLPLLYAAAFTLSLVWLAIAPWSPIATAIVASPFFAFLLFGNRVLDVPDFHVPRRPKPIAAVAWRPRLPVKRP